MRRRRTVGAAASDTLRAPWDPVLHAGTVILTLVAVAVLSSCSDGDPLLFGEPDSLESLSAEFQEGTVGERSDEPPRARVLDRRGNPAPGVDVEWSVTQGRGEITNRVTRSNDAGIVAIEGWTLGTAVGDNAVTASVSGAGSVEFRAVAQAGPPDSLHNTVGHRTFGTVAAPVNVLPRVTVTDRFGNPLEGVAITFEVAEGDGTLEEPETVSDSQGHASPADWILGPVAGIQSLEASSGGLTTVRFDVTARADVPDSVDVVEAGATDGRVDETIPGVIVEVRDQFGNPVGNTELEVRVVAGGGQVFPKTPTTDEEGRATLDWVLGPTAGTQRIEVYADDARHALLEVEAAPGEPAAVAAVEGQGQVAPASQDVPEPPTVRVTDEFGNPLEGHDVTFEVVEGGGSVQGSPARSDAEGVAGLDRWTLGPEVGEHRVEATLAGIASVIFHAEATEAVVRALQVVQGQDQQGAAGFPVSEPPGVRLVDDTGAPVSGETVSFTIIEGNGSVTPDEVFTDSQGLAIAQEWILGASPGWNRIRVAAQGAPARTISAYAMEGLQIQVEEAHVNQGSQSYPAAIPLLEGRAGLARIFLRANAANDAAPRVRVEFYHGSGVVYSQVVEPTLSSTPTAIDPEDPAGSWNLSIPSELVDADFGLRVYVDEDEEVDVVDRNLLAWPTDGSIYRPTTLSTAPFRSTFVAIESTSLGTLADLNPGNLDDYMSTTLDLFPIGEYDAIIRPDTFVSDASPLSGDDQGNGWSDLLQEIYALRIADGNTDPEALNRYYHGILRRQSGPGIAGIAYVATSPTSPALAAVSHDATSSRARVVAHEFGHNFGRWHAPCGGAGGIDQNWPSGMEYDDARIGTTGYSIASGQLISPSGNPRDIMSYCTPVWSSDYTWESVLAMREARPVGAPPMAAPGPSTEGLLVWGSWSEEAGPRLRPAIALRSREVPVEGDDAVIRGLDAQGGVLFQRGVEGLPLDHADDESLRQFTLFVALDERSQDALARIVLDSPHGTVELTSFSDGQGGPAGAPGQARVTEGPELQVTRVGPAGPQAVLGSTRLRIQWNADGFPLALLRDGPNGRVFGIVRSGDAIIPDPSSGTLTVHFSDGVRTTLRSVSDY